MGFLFVCVTLCFTHRNLMYSEYIETKYKANRGEFQLL